MREPFCASVLPWRSCGGDHPWAGDTHAERTRAAVDHLDAALPPGPLVWGGDWNHALSGREYAGSAGGRTAIADLLARRRLQVPTATLPHRLHDVLSIDHIAVSEQAHVRSWGRRDASGLSDHDAYVVEVDTVC